ncbi:MAG TPA: heavy metal translocating P-type ATPase [Hyphomicrobiaceae bacterium]|nr:heavy metal translocating P-type ATPase [Hyphomicrobiaceae bacterium]
MAQALTELALGDHADAGTSRAARCVTTILAVEGMHCGGCMRKVERALTAVPGVVAARANLSARRVAAVHGASGVNTTDLVEALDRAGFKAAELADDAAQPAKAADQALLERVGVAGFAAANIMLLSVSVWSGAAGDMTPSVQSLFHWLSALIALPVLGYAGQPFFHSAAQALRSRRLNMDVPISLGVTLATAMSLYQTARGSEQVYFDAAVTLLFFLLVGRFLDQRMRTRAAGAAANLLGLRGSAATVIEPDGTTMRHAARALRPGMRVLTVAGERFAVDGRVVEGHGEVDASLITGETMPVSVRPGTLIYAGTVNLSGSLVTEATATDQHTLLAEIARLMAAAEQARGRYVRLADRAARFYAPAVHILGLATFLGWLLTGHGWETALTAAIAVLIITCPCALALAVPAVQVAATSRLFAKGVLVKAPDGLERLAEVDTVVFDKTGTLTLGEPSLAAGQRVSDDILAKAASLAAASRHPYARAVVRAAEAAGLAIRPAAGVLEVPGFGLERIGPEGPERLGSAAWCGAGAPHAGMTAVCYRAGDGTAVAFSFEDRLRSDAADVVSRLHQAGFQTELLSGDRPAVVEAAAAHAGIRRWTAGAAPGAKIARLEALAAEGRKVLMVGDGLNDAPALAAGHASLSPSSAADITQTAADAILQGARLAPVLEAIAVARAAHRMALQNFAIAIGYNLLFVPLAMAGLVTPLLAAIAMSASSVAVTANAIRLRTMHLELAR